MTAQEYIEKGFAVSMHTEQAIIDRAERDARLAYIVPIVGENTPEEHAGVIADALANLAFLVMLQRNVFVTRSGAKMKQTDDSRDADGLDVLQNMAHTCDMKIQALRALPGANATAKVTDICRIYFRTNFFNS